MDYTPGDIAKMIDLSLLRPNLTDEDIIKGCETAKKYDVATVCCGPSQVPLVKKCLAGSKVIVSTVIGFPHGYSTTAAKIFEAQEALKEGAIELDMVLNIGKLMSRDFVPAGGRTRGPGAGSVRFRNPEVRETLLRRSLPGGNGSLHRRLGPGPPGAEARRRPMSWSGTAIPPSGKQQGEGSLRKLIWPVRSRVLLKR